MKIMTGMLYLDILFFEITTVDQRTAMNVFEFRSFTQHVIELLKWFWLKLNIFMMIFLNPFKNFNQNFFFDVKIFSEMKMEIHRVNHVFAFRVEQENNLSFFLHRCQRPSQIRFSKVVNFFSFPQHGPHKHPFSAFQTINNSFRIVGENLIHV